MRFLTFVSLLFLLTGCAPKAYRHLQKADGDATCVQKFRPSFPRVLYQASINVAGHQLSGLLLIKQMPDSSTRIVFTNEAGYSFFDFEFSKNGEFAVHAIVDRMDKAAVKTTLRKDFETVLMNRLDYASVLLQQKGNESYYTFKNDTDRYYYITDLSCNNLFRAERGSDSKKVMEVVLKQTNSGIPDEIHIRHFNFKFNINLTRINDAEQ
ncbi:MAG: hypothetical protein QM727_06510 [Niabella sp.]